MADCEEVLKELFGFLDGELTPAAVDAISHHLDGCLDCLQVYDFHAELRQVVAAKCQEPVPPQLLARIEACFGLEPPADGGQRAGFTV